jgi:hypothetical protein
LAAARHRRGDAFVIADLDEAGWAERYSAPDPTVAPPGHSLVQAQLPLRAGETRASGLRRLERMLDPGYPGWRDRQAWRRRAVANGRSGALDLPGPTWRDRPRVERGDGVFLASDIVAAPGLLSEVAFNSALLRRRNVQVRQQNTSTRKLTEEMLDGCSSGLGDYFDDDAADCDEATPGVATPCRVRLAVRAGGGSSGR